MEEKKYKKGDNPKGQGPCKPKKEKTKEEKEAARAKQAEKKRLKKEQARLEEERKKREQEGIVDVPKEENKDNKPEVKNEDKKEEDKKEEKKNKKKEKKEKKGKEEKEGKDNNPDEEKKGKEEKEQKKDKKISVKFYGLTTFEERDEQLKKETQKGKDKENENQESLGSSEKIIEYLSKKTKYSKVNQEIIYSLRNIILCGSSKQTKNCLNLLNSVKIFVDSVDGDDYTICTEVSSFIRKITKLIEGISEKCSGIFNTCKYLNQIADLLLKYPKTESAMFLKELIKSKIQYFIDRRVKKIEIDNIPENLIEEKDTILFLGKSKIFRKLLLKAKNKNINFKVIFADSPKRNQISSEIEYLSQLGIPVVYTYIKEVTNLMSKVTKVFIKGDSMLVNGYLLGKSGTSLLSLIAKYFNKPIYVFCPSFKFMNKIILNNNTDYKKMGPNLCEVNFDYDVTPSPYIETVVCENGYLHSSSIPVYIRELEKNDDDFINTN